MGVDSVSDCGGSATNSLVAASNYGSSCHHVCRVANDEDGKKYLDSLQTAGVKHIGYSKEDSNLPTGKCLIFVTPDAKRTMSSMLGISAYLGSQDIDYDAVDNSKIFYIEGYMVMYSLYMIMNCPSLCSGILTTRHYGLTAVTLSLRQNTV